MKSLTLKAQMLPALRKADGSVSLKFVTAEEITTDLFSQIDGWRQQNGWLLFKRNEFVDAEIPTQDAVIEGDYSPSDRLRRSLFKLYMLEGGKREGFSAYYQEQMAKFQTLVGDKIEAREQNNVSQK